MFCSEHQNRDKCETNVILFTYKFLDSISYVGTFASLITLRHYKFPYFIILPFHLFYNIVTTLTKPAKNQMALNLHCPDYNLLAFTMVWRHRTSLASSHYRRPSSPAEPVAMIDISIQGFSTYLFGAPPTVYFLKVKKASKKSSIMPSIYRCFEVHLRKFSRTTGWNPLFS